MSPLRELHTRGPSCHCLLPIHSPPLQSMVSLSRQRQCRSSSCLFFLPELSLITPERGSKMQAHMLREGTNRGVMPVRILCNTGAMHAQNTTATMGEGATSLASGDYLLFPGIKSLSRPETFLVHSPKCSLYTPIHFHSAEFSVSEGETFVNNYINLNKLQLTTDNK